MFDTMLYYTDTAVQARHCEASSIEDQNQFSRADGVSPIFVAYNLCGLQTAQLIETHDKLISTPHNYERHITHTAFRCSSRRGMRICPSYVCWRD